MLIKAYNSALFSETKVVGTHWSYYLRYVSVEGVPDRYYGD